MTTQTKPVSAATRAMLDEMEERDAVATPEDKLERARDLIRKLRDAELDAATLDERLKDTKRVILDLKEREIPSFFDEAGVPSLSVAGEGNSPPFNVVIDDRYYANIPAENRDAAFAYLRETGHEDLIKVSFTVEFGLREGKASDRFRRSLEKADIQYTEKCSVPWNTLSAWFRTQHRKKPLTAKAMALLGATVGRVAKVVTPKEKK